MTHPTICAAITVILIGAACMIARDIRATLHTKKRRDLHEMITSAEYWQGKDKR